MQYHLDFLRPRPLASPIPSEQTLVFLDSRDLIDCLERSRPIDSFGLGRTLRQKQARLVVTMTTLTELFPGGTVPSHADVERGVSLAHKLDHIPHCFVRHTTIPAREFRSAFRAWQSHATGSVEHVVPFVSRFYETLWKPAAGTTDVLVRSDESEMLHRMTVWEQLRILSLRPESLRWSDTYTVKAAAALDADRANYGSKRGTRAALEAAVSRHLQSIGFREPRDGVSRFAKWLRTQPTVCPGWRIGWDAWEEYRSNTNSPFVAGDLRDFSHLSILPYVTHFTADAKWRDMLGRARKRRERDNLPVPYFGNAYAKLDDVLPTL